MRWAAEERVKTQRWCEEQTAAATKERNAAAKMARDSRQKALTGAVPIRSGANISEITSVRAQSENYMCFNTGKRKRRWRACKRPSKR